MEKIGLEVPGHSGDRESSRAEPCQADGRVQRMDPKARLEGRHGKSLHAGGVDHLGQGTRSRTGDRDSMSSPQPIHQAHQTLLRAAGDRGVVYEHDPHGKASLGIGQLTGGRPAHRQYGTRKLARPMRRLALIHDYLLVMRGAERTFAAMSEIWPAAPIFTLLYDEGGTQGRFAGRAVEASPLQPFGIRQRQFRLFLPVLPDAIRRLKVDGFDCLVSSSSSFAHGIRKPAGATHVCYCHSPLRYAWHEQASAYAEAPPPLRRILGLILRRQRGFDRRAAAEVDQYVANSKITRERIRRFWGRDAPVVHPPVELERFELGEPTDYVLFVGSMLRHKRPDVAIEAAAAAGRRIKVVGDGPQLGRLQNRYGCQAEFLGRVDDDELARLYAQAAALVVPNVEEFGIAAVEAQAAGRPVVAVNAGGARETVVPGRTGLLVRDGDPGALARALREDFTRFDPHEIRAHAQRFSRNAFQVRLREIVEGTPQPPSRARRPAAITT
jgi:glycosyltransferase involved in cell wall biosynthesis